MQIGKIWSTKDHDYFVALLFGLFISGRVFTLNNVFT